MTLDPITVLQELWSYPFMVNAFRAGTIVAVLAGAVGWFMVLRRQSFSGHALATVAFPGGAGAVLIGISASIGYFAFCLTAAVILGLLPASRGHDGGYSQESAVTGTLQAFALACGFLFVSLYGGFLNGLNALLFGSFLGVTAGQVWLLLLVALVALGVLAAMGRPLLFSSIDPSVARARRVPVRLLSTAFLIVLGAAAAEASQITGALLVFALLVMPASAAQVLTARLALSLTLSVVIGVVVTWAGLIAAYYTPFPIGFFVTTFAFVIYLASHGLRRALDQLRDRPSARPSTPLALVR